MTCSCHVMRWNSALTAALATIALSGCANYIKRDEFDSTIADLRATDQRLQSQIDELGRKYDTLVTEMAGRVRVDSGAHFAVGDATLSDQDKPLLDDFARALRSRSDAVVTVEGFADPQGAAGYDQRLGQARADAVRDYLVGTGGLADGHVRAVSYGENRNRQVRPDAIGEEGSVNRRVSLVVDYAGSSSSMPSTMPAPEPAPAPQEEPAPKPET